MDSGQKGPHLLISAGVHGDEYEPILAARELVQRLPTLLTAGKVTIVPVVNPDAFHRGSRLGGDGLDLARICPGKADGTPSEKAAAMISEEIRQADYYIDMHTGGCAFRIYPLAGYMLHPSGNVLERQRQMARAFNLPLVWGTDHNAEGRTLSVARDAGVPAIYVEYGGGNAAEREAVGACIDGCIGVLRYLSMIKEADKTVSRLRYMIEDDRPGSGHLQAHMPAPVEGIFVPEVAPGDPVTRGQLWGNIHDVPTGRHVEIRADSDGMALFLRTAALVRKGDSLGGILQLQEQTNNVTER